MNSCDSLEHHFSTSVRDVVGNRHESAARLLLPVVDDSGRALPWSMLIPSTPPTVNTSWASIRHLTDRDIDPPYAHLRPEAAEHLTYALAQGGDPLCWFALWKGYAEVLQEQSPVPAPPPDQTGISLVCLIPNGRQCYPSSKSSIGKIVSCHSNVPRPGSPSNAASTILRPVPGLREGLR